MTLREEILSNQDIKYKDFHKKLIPEVPDEKLIGVRVPTLRKIAKVAYKENLENEKYYYEEIMVQGFVYGLKKCSVEEHIEDLKTFVPLIDNWAVCDCCCSSFKFVKKDLQKYYDFVLSYIDGDNEYKTRFAVVMLMDYYITDEYVLDVIDILKAINSNFHYVNMAVAWAFSVIFVKYPQLMLGVIESKQLYPDVQNKTIQKISDSFRVDRATKIHIKKFKISK